jgi:hypothetical protein
MVPGLKSHEAALSVTRTNNETYYRPCRLKMFRMWVLHFEPADVILEDECESAIIYARPAVTTLRYVIVFRMRTHQNVPRREPGGLPSTATP